MNVKTEQELNFVVDNDSPEIRGHGASFRPYTNQFRVMYPYQMYWPYMEINFITVLTIEERRQSQLHRFSHKQYLF